jgi:hypothetical protein
MPFAVTMITLAFIFRSTQPGCAYPSSFWSGRILTMGTPLSARSRSGISYTFVEYTLPVLVKYSIVAWFEAMNICSMKSSSDAAPAFTPTPPLFWVLYLSSSVRLMYPFSSHGIWPWISSGMRSSHLQTIAGCTTYDAAISSSLCTCLSSSSQP